MTDPVCHLSPHHAVSVDAREAAVANGNGDLTYRTLDPVPAARAVGFRRGTWQRNQPWRWRGSGATTVACGRSIDNAVDLTAGADVQTRQTTNFR